MPQQEIDGTTDADLLTKLCWSRDEQAFAEVVHRHGPMVLGVCLQILRRHHDAQDAFQATFLLLALRCRSIRRESSLAGWLYKVAYRTAMRSAKQRHKAPSETVTEEVCDGADPLEIIHERSLHVALHEELTQLPKAYRAPLVLCCLEGKTRKEAASELECTAAAVKARLARGKRMLRIRLSRRGIGLSVAVASTSSGVACAGQSLSGPLVAQTVSDSTITLTSGVLPGQLSTEVACLIKQGSSLMLFPLSAKSAAALVAVFAFLIAGWNLLGQDTTDKERPDRAVELVQNVTAQHAHGASPASLAIPVQLVGDDPALRSNPGVNGTPPITLGFLNLNQSSQPSAPTGDDMKQLQQEKKYIEKKSKAYFMLRDAELARAKAASDLASQLEARANALLHEAEAEKMSRQAEQLEQQLASRVTTSWDPAAVSIPPTPCCRENNLAYGRSVTASSQEDIIGNFAQLAVDGDLSTRWCADDYSEGEWIQVDLGAKKLVRKIRIHWEMMGTAYAYTIEGSSDGKQWKKLVDTSEAPETSHMPEHTLEAPDTRYLRITFLGSDLEFWGSIREIEVTDGELSAAPVDAWEKVRPDADPEAFSAFSFFMGVEL